MRKIMKKSIIFLGLFLVMFGWVIKSNVQASTPIELYDNVWRLINTKYVDQTNNEQDWGKWRHKYDNVIKSEDDAYVAIDTMVASLNDPYTKFLDPKEFKEETSSIKGSLKGIGVQIGVKDGKLLIIAPMEDTPGEKAGLKAEDEILEIDGKSTKGITVDKAADKRLDGWVDVSLFKSSLHELVYELDDVSTDEVDEDGSKEILAKRNSRVDEVADQFV